MAKIAVVLYGLPGSGKSTQAQFLSEKLGLIHFDTGKFLESVVYDASRQQDDAIRRERRLFETGKLMTPRFVLNEVKRQVIKIAEVGQGIIFSGSPRTLFEAEGLIPVLEKLYPSSKGKNASRRRKIFFFLLKISTDNSQKRNVSRWVCSFCKRPLLTVYYPSKNPKHCPICGGRLYRRRVDTKNNYSVRLEEYKKRTEPIFDFLRKKGYEIRQINGEQAPYKVFQDIYAILGKKI